MSGISFDWAEAMGSWYSDGHLTVGIDSEGSEDGGPGGVEPLEVPGIAGLLHRPLDPVLSASDTATPDPTQASGVLYGMRGGQSIAVVLDNPKIVADLPQLQPGETMLHGDQGHFLRFLADGSFALATTTAGGAVKFPDGSQAETVSLIFGPTGLTLNAPFGRLTFTAEGFHVLHKSGARFDLGGLHGMPSPLDRLTSYAAIQAGTTTIDASSTHIGPLGGTVQPGPLVTFESLMLYLTALQETLTAIAPQILIPVGLAAGVPNPAIIAAIESLNAPLALLQASGEGSLSMS